VYITKHAEKRMRERLGINKKSVVRIARKALEEGIPYNETKGQLRRFIDKQYFKTGIIQKRIAYNGYLYCFSFNDELITVLPLYHQLVDIMD
jgi:hypothetical protein